MDRRSVIRAALAEATPNEMDDSLRSGSAVALVTVTAPGRGSLDHYTAFTGELRVVDGDAEFFNAHAQGFWTAFRHALAEAVARRFGRGTEFWLAQVWELQRRGVLHLHLVVPFSTLRERIVARFVVDYLHEHHERHGFGFVDRNLEPQSGSQVSGYITKYLTKGSVSELLRLVNTPGIPARLHVVPRWLQALSGVTMATCRRGRWEWVQAKLREQVIADVVAELLRRGPTRWDEGRSPICWQDQLSLVGLPPPSSRTADTGQRPA